MVENPHPRAELGRKKSPLLGALHLVDVDRALGNQRLRRAGVYYLRYMDDILILTRTRWQLRRAIATLRRMLGELDLALHPEKRFIGRTTAGFDFLGYRFQSGRRTPLSLTTDPSGARSRC